MYLRRDATAQSERGNALFLILIAVVLFAALSYAITQSDRGSVSDSEMASMQVGHIMQYAAGLENGAMRLQIRGMDVEDILFNTPREAGYETNTHRQMFHKDGGGVPWALASEEMIASAYADTFPTYDDNGYWQFGQKAIPNIGTAADDTIAFLAPLKRNICEQINLSVTGSKTIPAVSEGSAAIMVNGGNLTLPVTHRGYNRLCFVASDFADVYMFYYVLGTR